MPDEIGECMPRDLKQSPKYRIPPDPLHLEVDSSVYP